MLDALRTGWRSLFNPAPSESDLGGQIQWAVDRRLGRADVAALPAVVRARELIVTTAAQLEPVAFRDGFAMEDQPAVMRRPAPGMTRYEWVSQIVGSLIDEGDAILWLPESGRNAEGWPDVAVPLPLGEVEISWSSTPFVREYRWHGRQLFEGRDLLHLALGRRAGDLRGHSPLDDCADALYRVLGTELYAADYFTSGAVPDVVLKYAGSLNDGEAAAAKARWMATHQDRSPAVLQNGWDVTTTGANPETSQLLESRSRGDVEVARVLGIVPAELLLITLASSSLTYQNVAQMLDTFVRVTVGPKYLALIEESFGDLLPRSQAVRFSTSELFRLAESERIATEATAIAAGIYTLPEVRRGHGLPAGNAPAIPPALQPTPAPPAASLGVPVQ